MKKKYNVYKYDIFRNTKELEYSTDDVEDPKLKEYESMKTDDWTAYCVYDAYGKFIPFLTKRQTN